MSATNFVAQAKKVGIQDAAWLASALGVCPAQVSLFVNQAKALGLK